MDDMPIRYEQVEGVTDLWDVMIGGYLAAGLERTESEREPDRPWLVTWGPGLHLRKRFATEEEARQFVEQNAEAIHDGDPIG